MVARSARNAFSLQPIPMSLLNPRNHTRATDRPRFLRAPHVCSAMTRRHQLSSHARTTDFAQTSIHAKLALQARRIGHGARLVHRRLVRRSVRGLASRRRAASDARGASSACGVPGASEHCLPPHAARAPPRALQHPRPERSPSLLTSLETRFRESSLTRPGRESAGRAGASTTRPAFQVPAMVAGSAVV